MSTTFTFRDTAFLGGRNLISVDFESETNTLLAALTGSYDSARQTAINTLIKALKDDGVWSSLSVLCIAGLNSTDSLINWRNPGTFNGSLVNSPGFTSDRGFTGSSNNYINTNFNPNTAGSPFTQDSNSFGLYTRINQVATDSGMGMINGSNQFNLRMRLSSGFFGRANEESTSDGVGNTDSSGMFLVTRPSSSSVVSYRNGSQIQSKTKTSVALSSFNFNFFVLAVNDEGTAAAFSTNQMAAYYFGGSLSSTESANFYTALNTYLTYIGANV